jgi:hypothetical protein
LTKWNRSTRLISVGLGMLGIHLQTRTNTRNQSIHFCFFFFFLIEFIVRAI